MLTDMPRPLPLLSSSKSRPRPYARAERIIRRLTTEPALGDDLAALAASEGLSAYHAQRSFRRWTGLSPKQFASFLRVCRAQGLLRAARSVLDVALDVGLSGPGRLHDHFITIAAMTPGQFKSGGEGLAIRHGIGATPLGDAAIAWTSHGICRLSFVDRLEADDTLASLRAEWPRAELALDITGARRLLATIFSPARRDPRAAPERQAPLALLVNGSRFQLAVWRALLDIPEGTIASYSQLAARAGAPAACRAVGTAVGQNRIAYLIPCHRVIRATGALGGYRWGLERKAALLAAEAKIGVPITAATDTGRGLLADAGSGKRAGGQAGRRTNYRQIATDAATDEATDKARGLDERGASPRTTELDSRGRNHGSASKRLVGVPCATSS